MAKVMKNEVSKAFRVGVSPEEKIEAGKDLCIELAEIDKLEEERKATNATFKEKIKERDEKARELRLLIDEGREVVFKTICHRNPSTGKIWWTVDGAQHGVPDGHILEKRDMTEEDDQLPLADRGEEEAGEAPSESED
jgi:hypothetical protein